MLKKLLLVLLFITTLLSATTPTQRSLTKLYIATFDRAPDASGLEYWLNSGMSQENIASSFFEQSETKEKYPDELTNEDFIIEVYTNILNRAPDQAGLDYWLSELDSGDISRSVFIQAAINGAQGDDATVLENKTIVGLAFARDGHNDPYEASAVMKNITADPESVNDALCEYSLSGCSEDSRDLSYDYITFWKQIALDLDEQTYSDAGYLYSLVPTASSCDMGVLSEDAKERALLVSNYTRELHGLSRLAYHYDFDEEVQASALIMKANNMITHHPDPSSMCYTQEGYTGSSTSNIYAGSANVDPAQHIIGWIDDAHNASTVSAVGHRRWSLNPFGEYTAYGQVDGFAALKVFGFGDSYNININIDYVAFPYKKYPYLFLSSDPTRPTPWSFSIVEKKDSSWSNVFDYFNNATINIKEKSSGNQLSISNKYYDKVGYGLANILTWQVIDWKYDTLYEVSITGVAMQSGEVKSFTYEVYIDYKDIITIRKSNEDGDTINGNTISGTLDNNLDEDSFDIYLSGTKTFTGKNSIYADMAFFINLYDNNKILIKSSDEPFTIDNLNGNYTVVVSHRSKEDGVRYLSNETTYIVEIGD